ncbi:MAG: SGNH/GDSL hydrolase family protein, partial [Myxococcota bacterium]
VDRLKTNKLNSIDAKRLERGYYEDLVDVARFNDQLASLYARQPSDWRGTKPVTRETGGFPPYEMIPSTREMYKGVLQGTNQWGMRDREYTREKPSGTYRIALLGSSHSKGSGVADHETYENLVEDRLNAEAPPGRRYEILNFAVGGYGPLARMAILSDRVPAFDPDAVLYVAIDDFTWMMNELSSATAESREVPFDRLIAVLAEVGITPGMARVVAEHRVKPRLPELVEWSYTELFERTRAQGALPLAMILPRPIGKSDELQLIASQVQLAQQAGFQTLDISDAYAGTQEWSDLWIAPWDNHPNAHGHRLLADRVHDELRAILIAKGAMPAAKPTKGIGDDIGHDDR